jgi:tRNA threonylcarbamoyladenosine biosynthesis protein TsaE
MTVPLIAGRHALIVKNMAWPDEAATQAFAQALAARPAIGRALIELHGDLGAGKTTFVRHLLHSLGVPGRIKSPTYAVVEPYTIAAPSADSGHNPELAVWHFDFYRFNDPQEWEEAGFRDIFASPGLKLVEWPQKAGDHLPLADLVIDIAMRPDESRSITLTAHTPTGVELLT